MKKSADSTTKRTRKSNKYVFTLKNVNTEKVDQKYNISLVSNLIKINQPAHSTNLSELDRDKSLDIISFLDESKRNFQCNATMIDFKNKTDINDFKYNCFWDRNAFDTVPIGCPIKYVPNLIDKNYFSEISRDNYIIKEKITKYRYNSLKSVNKFFSLENEDDKINIRKYKNGYYLTDCVFCSFNCCKAYIKDNKHNPLYDNSEYLLSKLYFDMNLKDSDDTTTKFDKNNVIFIESAPHWRLLEEYGGYLTITKFRENFNKILYEYRGIINPEIYFKSIGHIYEEKIKF